MQLIYDQLLGLNAPSTSSNQENPHSLWGVRNASAFGVGPAKVSVTNLPNINSPYSFDMQCYGF